MGTALGAKGDEIFVASSFAQIRPVWLGDLGTRPKYSESLWLVPYFYLLLANLLLVM
jgi:hypothetical protein